MSKATNDSLIKKLLRKGLIYIRYNGEIRNQVLDIHGYYVLPYKGKSLKCHRIAYQYFYGNLKATHHINHKDGNKRNNSRSNLEQITASKNIKHMFANIKRTKISRTKARNIRKLYATGEFSQTKLAKKYKCSTRYVQHIIHGTRKKE